MAGNDAKGRRRRSSSSKKEGNNKQNDPERTVAKKGRGANGDKRRGSDAKYVTPAKRDGAQKKKNDRRSSTGSAKKGKDGRRKSRGSAKAANKREKKEPMTAEQLDASMDDYWAKSKDKTIVSKKLDDDMDDYWAKKEEGKTDEEAVADKEETKEEATE